MAPKRGSSLERGSEYEDFIKTLAEFHKKRGTSFEPEPKVGVRHIDLNKLYARVLAEGGYDLMSDTKARPLMWRKLAEEFVGKNVYSAAQAFQVKQIYYKNLVAYEITNHWGKEPPPKEILEDVSAKGGNVMGRTLENFDRGPAKEEKPAQDTEDSELRTPKEEKMEEDPGSGTRRGLRQQPPQRVLFQPEARQTRQAAQPPMTNGFPTTMVNGASSSLASYEPLQQYPLSLRPVTTPANNPDFYRNERKRKLEAMAGPLAKKYRNIMLPGTGFIGPNIYVRAQLALQSGIPDEERYALFHLVKISHERGDKYRFDQFPGLTEALSRKILSASNLFYHVTWDIDYDEDETFIADDETLSGLKGTADIIAKLKTRPFRLQTDDVLDAPFLDEITRITEASLIFRNMCTMDDNARYAASLPLTRDVIAVAASLPEHWSVSELRHNMLETAELVLKFCDISTQEDLYSSLLSQMLSEDRGTVILTMRVMARIAMALPMPKRLDHIGPVILKRIQDWLLLDDTELRAACLDFLMQYTTFADNVENLLQSIDGEALARQLGQLLLLDAKDERQPRQPPKTPIDDPHIIPPVPRLSKSIIEKLLKIEEPERSSEWLRICFLPDPQSEMTQISLWQAYQGTFGAYQATHGNLVAGEFIKNVSAVFSGATAQVAGQNKYVIRGIRSRKVPLDTGIASGGHPSDKGKELLRCFWRIYHHVNGTTDPLTGVTTAPTTRQAECGEWFRNPKDMLKHILSDHLEIPTKQVPKAHQDDEMDVDELVIKETNGVANGATETTEEKFDFAAVDEKIQSCKWASCAHTSAEFKGRSRTALLARHIATHLPSTSSKDHNVKPGEQSSFTPEAPLTLSISIDEKNDAAGVPLNAALVLAHIARFMPGNTTTAKDQVRAAMGAEKDVVNKKEKQDEKLIEKIFGPAVKERMFFALAHCPPARFYVGSILKNIRRSGG